MVFGKDKSVFPKLFFFFLSKLWVFTLGVGCHVFAGVWAGVHAPLGFCGVSESCRCVRDVVRASGRVVCVITHMAELGFYAGQRTQGVELWRLHLSLTQSAMCKV